MVEAPVTLDCLHSRLSEKEIYKGSTGSLYSVLKKAGFSYKKDDPRRGLMEKPDVAAKRRRFLESYVANENHGQAKKPYVFLDETWIFSNGSHRKSWQDDDIRSVKRTTGDGHRLVIISFSHPYSVCKNFDNILKSYL